MRVGWQAQAARRRDTADRAGTSTPNSCRAVPAVRARCFGGRCEVPMPCGLPGRSQIARCGRLASAETTPTREHLQMDCRIASAARRTPCSPACAIPWCAGAECEPAPLGPLPYPLGLGSLCANYPSRSLFSDIGISGGGAGNALHLAGHFSEPVRDMKYGERPEKECRVKSCPLH